jgi:hypothetical protein
MSGTFGGSLGYLAFSSMVETNAKTVPSANGYVYAIKLLEAKHII